VGDGLEFQVFAWPLAAEERAGPHAALSSRDGLTIEAGTRQVSTALGLAYIRRKRLRGTVNRAAASPAEAMIVLRRARIFGDRSLPKKRSDEA
jgi:hypothetical protein